MWNVIIKTEMTFCPHRSFVHYDSKMNLVMEYKCYLRPEEMPCNEQDCPLKEDCETDISQTFPQCTHAFGHSFDIKTNICGHCGIHISGKKASVELIHDPLKEIQKIDEEMEKRNWVSGDEKSGDRVVGRKTTIDERENAFSSNSKSPEPSIYYDTPRGRKAFEEKNKELSNEYNKIISQKEQSNDDFYIPRPISCPECNNKIPREFELACPICKCEIYFGELFNDSVIISKELFERLKNFVFDPIIFSSDGDKIYSELKKLEEE